MTIRFGGFYFSFEFHCGKESNNKMPTGKRLIKELKKELLIMYHDAAYDTDYKIYNTFSQYITYKIPVVKAYRTVEQKHGCLTDLLTEKEAVEKIFGFDMEHLPKGWVKHV